ncbi:unnamed protein product [Trifolium pratense]|uniref:Uncharacterized protein n=1 Tax=Trifolium pratense TaxID=57577 RepID=A0ACB0JSW6_TRIPR|nr:unnamed protein product [Trifolium pratense]
MILSIKCSIGVEYIFRCFIGAPGGDGVTTAARDDDEIGGVRGVDGEIGVRGVVIGGVRGVDGEIGVRGVVIGGVHGGESMKRLGW